MENKTTTVQAGAYTPELPELLTLQQASKILKVHPNTLRNWERAGMIPVVRVGPRRDRRFPKHGIHQFLPGQQPATNLAGAPIETAPAESFVDPPTESSISQAAAVTPEGVEVPISVGESGLASEQILDDPGVEQATQETPHVIVNIPSKQSSIVFRVVIGIVLITLAIAVTAILFRQLGTREPTAQESTFAIRRNPPSVLFSDGFEAYEIGEPPRTVWSSVGVWKVDGHAGERYLRGEAFIDNPLELMTHIYTGSSAWKDYQFRFNARIVSGDKAVTALVNYLDEDNFYIVSISDTEASITLVANGQRTELGKTLLGNLSLPPISDGAWHTFSIALWGDAIDVFLDGERAIGVDNSALTAGKVGLVAENQVVDFDHVQIIQQTGETPQN